MEAVSDGELIEMACSVVNSKKVGDYLIGDVGCCLISGEKGIKYFGVCIDVASSLGFCAEHAAISSMITCGEFKISRIVAVWKDEFGNPFILSPCGRCREFMRQIHPDNIDLTNVILDVDHVVKLRDLLPYSNTFNPVSKGK